MNDNSSIVLDAFVRACAKRGLSYYRLAKRANMHMRIIYNLMRRRRGRIATLDRLLAAAGLTVQFIDAPKQEDAHDTEARADVAQE